MTAGRKRVRYTMKADEDVQHALCEISDSRILKADEQIGGEIKFVSAANIPRAQIEVLRRRLAKGELTGSVEAGAKKLVEGLPEGGALLIHTDDVRKSLRHERRHSIIDLLKPDFYRQLAEEIKKGQGYDELTQRLRAENVHESRWVPETICHGIEVYEYEHEASEYSRKLIGDYKFTDRAIAMFVQMGLEKPMRKFKELLKT